MEKIANRKVIQTEKGYFLTLNERKIIKLMVDEANERIDYWFSSDGRTFETELKNVDLLISDYIRAYLQGNITKSDVERCG